MATFGAAIGHSCTRNGSTADLTDRWRKVDELLLNAIGKLHLSDEIGEAYLSRVKLELSTSTADVLLERLRLRVASPASVEKRMPTEKELLEALAEAVRDDFSKGRICRLDGWYLSVTECQVAAIGFLNRQVGSDSLLVGYVPGTLCKIDNWGPRSTPAGKPFNIQSDGSSALWLRTTGAPSDAVVILGRVRLRTTVSDATVTADLVPQVSDSILSSVGEHSVYLVSAGTRVFQRVGEFEVTPEAFGQTGLNQELREERIADIAAWGPTRTRKGVGFNVQPGGESAFWVKTTTPAPATARLLLGGVPLRTTVRHDAVTAALVGSAANALLRKVGRHPLVLLDADNGRKQTIGEFEVAP